MPLLHLPLWHSQRSAYFVSPTAVWHPTIRRAQPTSSSLHHALALAPMLIRHTIGRRSYIVLGQPALRLYAKKPRIEGVNDFVDFVEGDDGRQLARHRWLGLFRGRRPGAFGYIRVFTH